jgi:hypothetical protein
MIAPFGVQSSALLGVLLATYQVLGSEEGSVLGLHAGALLGAWHCSWFSA